MPTLLRLTQFESDPNSHGACRRTLQIREQCNRAGFDVEDIRPSPTKLSRWRLWLRGLRWTRPGLPPVSHLPYGPGLAGFYDAAFSQAMSRFEGAKVVLWESTYDRILPGVARRHGFRVVALPHNLESLGTPDTPAVEATADRLANEASRLGAADAIFTIAREEQWLLAGLGLASHYLPYFPPSDVVGPLRQVRERRRTAAKPRSVLILGNALHPPTAVGMTTALHDVLPALPPGWQIAIAGFGSEKLTVPTDDRITVHGPVTPTQLESLLVSAAVLLTHQRRGAGALTRIPESLVAGLPVLANPIAARSTSGLEGVYVYETAAELGQLLRTPLPMPSEPSEPASCYAQFHHTLRTTADAAGRV